MGISYSAELRFGVVFPEDYAYDHYDPNGAGLESDSEWQEYEYPSEALEAHVDRLAKGTNLCLVTTGYCLDEEDTQRPILALKEPVVKTGGSGDYYTAPFDSKRLDVGDPAAHAGAIEIAKKLGLDWRDAAWLLTWSVG